MLSKNLRLALEGMGGAVRKAGACSWTVMGHYRAQERKHRKKDCERLDCSSY